MQVELLIRSHDCYSLGCSVDGIAEVLKVCRDVTYRLYRKKLYKLMVSNNDHMLYRFYMCIMMYNDHMCIYLYRFVY